MTIPTSSISSSKRPLRRLVAFALALAALLIALHWLARWLEGPEHIAVGQAELASVAGSEGVVLGPSNARQLHLPAMCVEGPSIANSGQDLFESTAFAHHLIDRGDVPPLFIIVNAADFHLANNGSPGTARRTRRIETYRLLQSLGDWRLVDRDWAGAVRAAVLPALGYGNWRARARKVWYRQRARESQGRRSNEHRSYISLTPEEDRRYAREWVAARDLENSRIAYRDSEGPQRAARELVELSQRLQSHGSRLVVVNMPLSPAIRPLLNARPAADLLLQERFFEALRAGGIRVIDGTAEPGIADDIRSFRDSTHMQGRAGAAFSRIVGERLADSGHIEEPTCEVLEDIGRRRFSGRP